MSAVPLGFEIDASRQRSGASEARALSSRKLSSADSRALLTLRCPLQPFNIQLGHLQHGLRYALRFFRILVSQKLAKN